MDKVVWYLYFWYIFGLSSVYIWYMFWYIFYIYLRPWDYIGLTILHLFNLLFQPATSTGH